MKLKFINLLLAAVLLVGSAQVLTSCKDTNEDLYANLKADLTNSLNQHVLWAQQQLQALDQRIQDLENHKCPTDHDHLTPAEVQALINQALQNYQIKNEADVYAIIEKYFQTQVGTGSASGNPVVDAIIDALEEGGYLDSDNYYTKEEVNQLISQAVAGMLTESQVQTIIENYLGTKNYVTQQQLNDAIAAIRQCACDSYTKEEVDTKLAELEAKLADYVKRTDFDTLVAAYLAANADYQALLALKQEVADALAALSGNNENLGQFFVYVETTLKDAVYQISQLQNSVGAISTQVSELVTFKENWESVLPQIQQDAIDALNQATTNKNNIEALQTAVQALQDQDVLFGQKIDALETAVNAAQQRADDAYQLAVDNLQAAKDYTDAQIQALKDEYDATIQDLQDQITANADDIRDLKEKVKANTEAIQLIRNELESIYGALKNLENRVSSIVLQGTDNAVFGYLATPLGINSNILINYIGENQQAMTVQIPSTRSTFEYDQTQVITDEDLAILNECGIKGESFGSGETLMNDYDGNLGTVYLTINPANIDLEGKEFTVVNSLDKESAVKLKNLRPSNKELTFGYSRTETSENGFYEADATVDPAQASQIRLVLDQELKSAAKEILTDRSRNTILALGNSLYNQFNGILPALGIKAAWDENGAAQSVRSNYGVAATVFHPLSYAFLYGKSFRQIHLPDLSDFKFNLSDYGINVDLSTIKLNINLSGVALNVDLGLSCNISEIAPITVTVTGIPSSFEVDDDGNVTITGYDNKVVDVPMTSVVDAINAALDQAFADMNATAKAQIEAAFQDALAGIQDKINAAVNDMLAQIQVKIDETLADVIDTLETQINGKIQKLINRFTGSRYYDALEKLVDRFNAVMKDPNHYLQATLLYHNGTSYGMMSNFKGLPTQFKLDGGNAVMLVPTTYTGEVVSPAFRKFVAVTNVYKADDLRVSAQTGNAKCKELLQQANAQDYVNEAFTGERRTVPFYFEGGQGYTYEIVYQALDYSGFTSTQKFYVTIK